MYQIMYLVHLTTFQKYLFALSICTCVDLTTFTYWYMYLTLRICCWSGGGWRPAARGICRIFGVALFWGSLVLAGLRCRTAPTTATTRADSGEQHLITVANSGTSKHRCARRVWVLSRDRPLFLFRHHSGWTLFSWWKSPTHRAN